MVDAAREMAAGDTPARNAAAREAGQRIDLLTRAGAADRKDCRLSFAEWCSLIVPGAGRPGEERLLIADADLLGAADRLRYRLHPDRIVTYVVDRNINYTNVCSSVCNFCAFSRSPDDEDAYVLSHDDIFRRVEETLEVGGSGILLQGGLHPHLPLGWYTRLLGELKRRYAIHLHCFSPTEIFGLSEVTGLSAREILLELKQAGLDSMPGGGAEILVDEIRRKRRSKVSSRQWLEIMETAHEVGLPTTATMMFGHGETARHRLEHLESIRRLQERTGGFIAFIPWNFQPDNTPLGRRFPERTGAEEYLRWLAISRLYLDGIPNVQVSWLTQGLDVGRRGLRAGANDLGSTMIEENVIRPAGARHEATEGTLRRIILEEGFEPVLRNAAYARLRRGTWEGMWRA
jgi:cyclic dehypoxanthinyl futalosine synthase